MTSSKKQSRSWMRSGPPPAEGAVGHGAAAWSKRPLLTGASTAHAVNHRMSGRLLISPRGCSTHELGQSLIGFLKMGFQSETSFQIQGVSRTGIPLVEALRQPRRKS